MDYVAGILVAALLAVVIAFFQRRKTAESWAGAVTGVRRWSEDEEDRAGADRVRIDYRRDDGRTGRLELDRHTYTRQFPSPLKTGDRLLKAPGDSLPRRAEGVR